MKRNRKLLLTVFAAAVLFLGCAGAVLASQGTASDPLVSLSYLTDKYTPEVLTQVDARITSASTALLTQMRAEVSELQKSVDAKIAAIDSSGSGGAAASAPGSGFVLVTLARGQSVSLALGGEALLRVGSAVCVADSAPGLVDLTDASSIAGGAALVKNHLYLATIENRAVRAAADTVKLLVRGNYTVS